MTVEHLEILVEEPSMEAALRILLPKIVGDLSHEVYPYQCKDELLKRLPERLRGYASWLPETWRIVVVLDRDDDDCGALKGRLEETAYDAGLMTRSVKATDWRVVNRLAIEKLEAWYFGDWEAVRHAYGRVPARISRKQRFRDPDAIRGGTWEALEQILQRAGYFKGGLRKIEAARSIGEYMEPDRNRSRSFQALRSVLCEVE